MVKTNETKEAEFFATLEEAAQAAVLEVPAPRKRIGWHAYAFEPLGGRRPSRVLERHRNLILFQPVSLALSRLSELSVGPPLLKPAGRPVMVREFGLAAAPPPTAPADRCGRSAMEVPEAQMILSKPVRFTGGFVFDESARAGAEAELRRCFCALSTRPDGLSPRDWWLLQESKRLEKRAAWTDDAWKRGGWRREKKRTAALAELAGLTPAAVRVAISRARLKLGERRHGGSERKFRN